MTETTPAPKERSYRCANHEDREGVGICVLCRKVVCVECSTKIDGINHCKRCLSSQATKVAEHGPSRLWTALQRAAAAVAVAASLLATTAAIAATASSGGTGGGRVAANRARLAAIGRGLHELKRDASRFPDAREGLRALVERDPLGDGPIKGWRGPYVDQGWFQGDRCVDAFGNPILYRPNGAAPEGALLSAGPNGQVESDLAEARRLGGLEWAPAEGDDVILLVE